jgi:hypothetical protein
MRQLFLLLLIAGAVHADKKEAANNVYQISASRVCKTGDVHSARSLILETTGAMGGWMTKATSQEICLRLPRDSVTLFLTMVDSLGLITDRSYQRSDHTNEYLKLIASIQAKEQLLRQYFGVLDAAGTKGIFPVSKSIADLQKSIETLKGQLRGMLERMEYAEVKIHFEFFDRRPPLTTGYSDFEWLNSVNLPSLIEDFE